jgi:hypothetical protein
MPRANPTIGFVALSLAVHGIVGAGAVVIARGRAHDPTSDAPPAVVLAGETFDLGDLVPPPRTGAPTAPADPAPPPEATTDPNGAPAPRPRPTAAPHASATASAAGSGEPAAAGTPERFGAVGDRSAVDIAVAFTRSFPQASSADPFWQTVPFGDCGATNVTFVLADDGTLESWSAAGAPSEALKRAIDRTLALIKGRTFTAAGKTTTLRVSAKVSPDDVHDGLHGDVFAVGGSYSGGEGTAFFALSIGRRVDVTVRANPK